PLRAGDGQAARVREAVRQAERTGRQEDADGGREGGVESARREGRGPPGRGDGRPSEGTSAPPGDVGVVEEPQAVRPMIRIVRGSQAPEVLRTRGRKATEEACQEYDSGADLSEPDPNIYAHEQVKQALLAAQNGKCAFCETKLSHQQFGDVEHFRPKRGY